MCGCVTTLHGDWIPSESMLPMHITIFCIPSPGKLHATLYLWMDGCYGIDTKSGSIPVNGPNRCRYSSGCWFLACLVRYACLRLLRGRKEGFPPPPPSQEKSRLETCTSSHFIGSRWKSWSLRRLPGFPFPRRAPGVHGWLGAETRDGCLCVCVGGFVWGGGWEQGGW